MKNYLKKSISKYAFTGVIFALGVLLMASCENKEKISKFDDIVNKKIEAMEKESKEIKSSIEFIKSNNDFAYKTFQDMMEDYKNGNYNYIESDNLVYSPYSYYRALSLLGTTVDTDIDILKEVSKVKYSEIGKINNINSADIGIYNKKFYDIKKESNSFFLSEFPNDAENISRSFQNNILGEVLLEPDYSNPEIRNVFLNATHFLGYWKNSFDKEMTYEEDFNLIDGKTVKKEFMHGESESKSGFEDERAAVTYKFLTEEKDGKEITSKLYVVVPKTEGLNEEDSKKLISEVGQDLKSYIEREMDVYDEVYLSLPKVKIKTKIDLLVMGRLHDYGFSGILIPNENYMKPKDGKAEAIDSIIQVATLELDEEKVEAKAVTEIVIKSTAVQGEQTKILNVVANRPYFIVITSLEDNREEVISFISYIEEPKTE